MRIILIIILVYIFFRILVSFVLPLIVRWYLNKSREKFFRDHPQYAERQKKKEGEMTISIKRTSQVRPNSDKLGEYTDFEELKDDEKLN